MFIYALTWIDHRDAPPNEWESAKSKPKIRAWQPPSRQEWKQFVYKQFLSRNVREQMFNADCWQFCHKNQNSDKISNPIKCWVNDKPWTARRHYEWEQTCSSHRKAMLRRNSSVITTVNLGSISSSETRQTIQSQHKNNLLIRRWQACQSYIDKIKTGKQVIREKTPYEATEHHREQLAWASVYFVHELDAATTRQT